MSRNEVIIEAFSNLAPRYEEVVDAELRRFWGWSYERLVHQLIEAAAVSDGNMVLDVATGTALIPRMLAERLGTRGQIVGLDLTLAMLQQGQKALEAQERPPHISLVCASAMGMPFAAESFDIVICGLAMHHMNMPQVLGEMKRVLRIGGRLAIVDAGASSAWRLPGIKTFMRVGAFLYFLRAHGLARAWAEAAAISNVRRADEWGRALSELGLGNARTRELPSYHFWCPAPLLIRATKSIIEAKGG